MRDIEGLSKRLRARQKEINARKLMTRDIHDHLEPDTLCREAANAIDRLTDRLIVVEKALRPFAEEWDRLPAPDRGWRGYEDNDPIPNWPERSRLRVKHLRLARAALTPTEKPNE